MLETGTLLGERWNAYNTQMRDRLYEVRSLNERKEFKSALDQAANLRRTTKIYGFDDEQLRQQEAQARTGETEKEKKRQLFKAAGDKVRAYDYQGALKVFDEGFADASNLFNGTEPEYIEANKLREEAYLKNKRLWELLPFVQRAAEDTQASMTREGLQNALKSANEALALQPPNEQARKWRAAIEAKLAKMTTDSQKINEARNLRAQGEAHQRQGKIADAIASYRQSLNLVPDKALADHVRLLEAEQAKAGEKKAAAERAWQEGTALLNQGKPSDALTRFKESVALLPDAQRSQYVRDLEGRRQRAQQLRDEGAKLQQQNRVADAISRYN